MASTMDLTIDDLPTPTPSIVFPSNSSWTIYGRHGPLIYAQPSFISYPLFIPIHIQGDVLLKIGISGISDGFITSSALSSSKFYNRVLKILTSITANPKYDFTGEYRSLPFGGCRILISCVADGPMQGDLESLVEWCDRWESSTRSLVVLSNFWGFPSAQMPAVLPLSSLTLRAWLHDTVALVEVASEPGHLWAFKTNRIAKSLYQEIQTLLALPPHLNIIGRPSYLITKDTEHSRANPQDTASLYCREPNQPIIGFLTPYHPGGTLKMHIRRNPSPPTHHRAKWAYQLTSALHHIFTHGGSGDGRPGMYTALKMDNIILSAQGDLVLIDFELAGTWIQYTPAEVLDAASAPQTRGPRPTTTTTAAGPKYQLSATSPPGEPCRTCSPHPCSVPRGASKAECYRLHEAVLSYRLSTANILSPLKPNSERGRWAPPIAVFWSAATPLQVEAAMVWMLGCCLWCVFEARPCLSDLGAEWFPVRWPLWKRARDDAVPERVLAVVERALKTDGGRPRLAEIMQVMGEWAGAVEEKDWNADVCLGDSGGDGSVGKRPLSWAGSVLNVTDAKKRKVEDSATDMEN